ncbi:DUF2125 domain-containing protein [Marinovum sp. 2_MG-2023]|uniref:DUF2125 domain-containing protein n=1 Tax=unclassified Marinovum TaxID=2647166 RepID=UPI0026E3D899|nr:MULTISPECIES: DUF2125 domain-containing protein [unclassified Marinovum]MDO6730286.1 DUF2125 domain-containing protein [Marinovum sp. 2_MG-2023]MDO6779024.1 DUF2125 domain-containing protein [Marinovum sp. 1_MG-2023]
MSSWKKLTGTTALATLALVQSAAADVTPDQVWADLKGYMEGYGYTVTATENTSGDTLTLSEIVMSIPIPEANTSATVKMPEITLTQDGGAVDVAWPADMNVVLDVDNYADPVTATIRYETDGLDMKVSGAPNDTTWVYSATSTKVSLAELIADGDNVPAEVFRGALVLTGLSGQSAIKTDEMRDIAQTMSIDSVSYDFAGRDPDNAENTMLFKGGLEGLSYGSTGKLPLEIDPEDPTALLQVMDIDGEFSYDSGNTQFNFVEHGDAVNFASSSAGGVFNMAMTPQAWSYDFLVDDYDVQMQGGDIPFPIALKADELGGNIALPVSKSDEPADVAAGITLGNFVMNDLIWNIFDSGAQLPRDPATIKIDLTGKARMLFDLFDPEQAEEMAMSDMPAELHELTLNSLVIDAVGAVLTGSGAFTFDNSDLQTFGGMPRPLGEVNAELTGANALIDKLVAMGIVPEEQAMGARMMMGMFAVTAGDDVLKSKIEVNEQGHVLANGQRIQ